MNRIECPGLDGSNPLHFLASLGVLRSLPDGSRMGWVYKSKWIPWFESAVTNAPTHLSQAIRRGVKDHEEIVSAKKRDGSIDKVKCISSDRIEIEKAYSFLNFSEIPKTSLTKFREAAYAVMHNDFENSTKPSHSSWILSSLNAENTTDKEGLLEPTAYSFSNGGGKQFLHKDFLSLVSLISPKTIKKMFSGDESRFVWFTSLNWDPMALRPYAVQWDDPESSPKMTDVAANVFAFIGLGSLPVIPTKYGNIPLCYDSKRRIFSWPLWVDSLDILVINSLLATSSAGWGLSSSLGIVAQFESERFSSNKRLYFSPSRSL